ncbi:MAG: VWA domain-containing protein [Opitutaceae bacterium]|nr:VWA domain-containing protein [Opitutaceae bacterium]
MKTRTQYTLAAVLFFGGVFSAIAGGTLTPVGSSQKSIQIRDHQVNVVLNNGFAQTEVIQTFFNPNPQDLEAIYAFPVPRSASLSEVTLTTGEKTLEGEVLPKKEAETIHEEEKKAGNDTGIASKNSYQTFEFRVSPVHANSEVKLRFVYYQPLEIDTGVGRYVYPLEEGGTDDVAKSFWTTNSQVEGQFSINLVLKSAVPVTDVRSPGFEGAANIQRKSEGNYTLTLDRPGAKLDRDFVFYYRLAENLPGRVEIIPYRADPAKPGTFMMVVTPGLDLKPLNRGADYVYVLDVSGSMQGKIHTLANGVCKALGTMQAADRFRIVTFNSTASELIPWTAATTENVQTAIERIKSLRTTGGTNLYSGLALALKEIDADRATSLVLVTDGVANQGIVQPAKFHHLLKEADLRVFGFLMGNSSNWPLMRTIADATGGFYSAVSNDDDIVGQIMLAKSKIAFESMHDASFRFNGARVFDTTGDNPKKIYRGQQLVLFGRYEGAGKASVTLKATLTGEDKTYSTTFDFPETDTGNPEIERLWAMAQIEQIELQESIGATPADEAGDAIQALGVAYQIVTDQTTMLLLDDDTFAKRGISRNNRQRTALERQAQSVRAQEAPRSYRVDAAQPAFASPAPHISQNGGGAGGGALDPSLANLALLSLLIAAAYYSRRHLRTR